MTPSLAKASARALSQSEGQSTLSTSLHHRHPDHSRLLLQLHKYPTMYECCGRSFDVNGLRQHFNNSSTHSNEIECHWCFARWPTHEGKLRLKHEQDRHWYRCKECTCIFCYEDELQKHVDEEHPPNCCFGCQRSFHNPENLNQVIFVLR